MDRFELDLGEIGRRQDRADAIGACQLRSASRPPERTARPMLVKAASQQVDRSLRRIWPRAQSKLYEEPKKLVAHGYAKASDDSVGRRRRTRYTITAKGRRALGAWLQEPGEGPILECEQLLEIHMADSGTKADLIRNVEATRADRCL